MARGAYGKNLSGMAIGPGGENGVRYACIINEDDRASGRGGTGAVMGSKNLKAVVVKSGTEMPKPADRETFVSGHKAAMQAIQESDVTAPNEGGLSVYGTNVLMNLTEEMDGLPTRNGRFTSTSMEAEEEPDEPNIDSENLSGENVEQNILVNDPTCHSRPVACKKEVEVDVHHKGQELNVRMESYEYESAWALGPNSMNDDRDKIALMLDRCNDLGIDTIDAGNMLAFAMEATEKGYVDDLDESLDWGDVDEMVDMLSKIAHREGELCELDAMKEEYYEHRGWVDGVVPDEKLDELGIDIGPGTGVSASGAAPADD